MARRRPSMGRQRIPIHRIESKQARYVCFSKRRVGLFNKASELAILCGVHVAAVVFSPTGKAYSFGHPSVEPILERFAPTGAAAAAAGGGAGAGAGEENNRQLAELNRQNGELKALLDAEKARKERAKERAAASPVAAWLEADVRAMGEEELMEFAAALQEVKAALSRGRAMAARARFSNNNQVPPPLPLPQQQFLADNGGGFVGQFGAGSANNNGGEMEVQIQQMVMELMMQQGFGPY